MPRIAEIAKKLGKKIYEAERRAIPIVFADTLYWIAIFLPNDPWADSATAVDLGDARLYRNWFKVGPA